MVFLFIMFLTFDLLVMCRTHVSFQCNKYVIIEKKATKEIVECFTGWKRHVKYFTRGFMDLSDNVPAYQLKADHIANLHTLFSLSRRLTKLWMRLLPFSKVSIGNESYKRITEILDTVSTLPVSSVRALVRLQEVYNISTEILVGGEVEGVFQQLNLTGSDCYDIGLYYYQLFHFNRSIEWFLEGLNKIHGITSRKRVLELLHLAYCFKGDLYQSNYVLRHLLKEFPSFKPSSDLLLNHTAVYTKGCVKLAADVRELIYKDDEAAHWINDSVLCRQLKYRPPIDKQLRCRMIHYNRIHLRIAPFKMEELHLDPPILMFHDVIYDQEINYLRTTYHSRTRFAHFDYGKNEHPQKDLQYNLWIREKDPKNILARRISKRTSDITNMGLHRAEPCMLASYGLGAEIKSHTDLGDVEHDVTMDYTRADYVTFLYYLSEDHIGGQTIFPNIGLVVPPVKGNALLWLNRYPDWTPINNTLHSSCPLLKGSKWILTKWIHVMQQDFPKCVTGRERTWKYYYLQ